MAIGDIHRVVCARPGGCGWSWDRITVGFWWKHTYVYGGPIFEHGPDDRVAYRLITAEEFDSYYVDCQRHLVVSD